MNGTKINAIAKALLDVYSKSIKPLFKPCPLSGRLNLTIQYEEKNNFISMLPVGNYQFGEKMYCDEDPDLFAISFKIKIY
jgi:hypothetical protein